MDLIQKFKEKGFVPVNNDCILWEGQKWLREIHGIHIEILLSDEKPYNYYYSRVLKVGKYFTLSHNGIYSKSYEECLEKALQEELNKLNYEKSEYPNK